MNTYKGDVRDAIATILSEELGSELECMPPMIADAVFNALGIAEAEQDMEGGHFMHHEGEKAKKKDPVDMFMGLNLPQKMVIAETAINNAFKPYEKGCLVRKLFIDMFRASDGEIDDALSADDCYEIFQSILKGGSDITYKTLSELVGNYEGGHGDFVLFPFTEEIKEAVCPEEAMFFIAKELLNVVIPQDRNPEPLPYEEFKLAELVSFTCPAFSAEGFACELESSKKIKDGTPVRCKATACEIRLPL